MFVRLPASVSPWADPEAQFHYAEICALVWAAAALSAAPVINRPDAFGLVGRCSSSSSVLRRRARHEVGGIEVFASALPEPSGPADEWWIEPQVVRMAMPWTPRDTRVGPFRAGQVRPGFELKSIIVVGNQTFGGAVSHGVLDIAGSSVEICRTLGITFACVTWRCYGREGTPVLVQVSPQPSLTDIGDLWNDVVSDLLTELAQ
jgi:hypothetical protein